MGSLILGLLIALAATFTARSISRSYEKEIEQKNIELDKNYSELKILHEQVNEQKSEIEAQRDFVLEQNVEIASKNKQITDSINYAQKIQTAVLPSLPTLNKIIPQNFVLYLPKDIVSGDFYWFTSINNKSILVAADCTGHGVPGAFMSMLGVTLLNEIVNNRHILQADEILNELRRQVKAALNQDGDTGEQKDGMDISLCILDNEKNELEFAGAYNSLYLIRKEENQTDFQLHEVKADHMPIGVHPKDNLPFTKSTISIQDNDVIYLFSDGYVSQFGSDKNEKFKTKRLQQALLAIQKYEIQEQKYILEKILLEWKGERQQVDDILIIGIKI
jgi:serine phosphatase RsbU (regulator of sigma subunit)